MAQRIAAAGFSDFLIVRDGSEANAIALGRYGSEDGARRRAAALVAAGFDAKAEPIANANATTWLDVAAGAGFDAAAAQAAVAAPQRRPLDCARLQ
jgi:ATP phosphoribosyltransferase regulatory subunit HisZ